jgi:uncharacterized protein (TIGR00299 family) protein
MAMAALVNAGVPFEALLTALRTLPLQGFDLIPRHVRRSSIDALHIDVTVSEQPRYHRHLKDIIALIDAGSLSPGTRERARHIFTVLAEAEAAVHATTVEKIHFHEVGAVDSIVDIVGTAFCLDYLGIEHVYSSPVRLGSGGLITTQHGTMPTPAPATAHILRGYPVVLTSIADELTTPTGAAILKALSRGVLDTETLNVSAVGYGTGTKDLAGLPNLLRVMVGEIQTSLEGDDIVLVETNIDDMNPQMYPVVMDRLFDAGAQDVYMAPIIMKKGRPGIMLSVMAPRASLDAVTQLLFRETSSIGLRIQPVGRRKLPRRELVVPTRYGPVRAKAVLRNGTETISPEFEECRRIASEHHLPVADVVRHIQHDIVSGPG